jgi:hypothetical protein
MKISSKKLEKRPWLSVRDAVICQILCIVIWSTTCSSFSTVPDPNNLHTRRLLVPLAQKKLWWEEKSSFRGESALMLVSRSQDDEGELTIWEQMARPTWDKRQTIESLSPTQLNDYVQYISILRVGIPALAYATVAKLVYPSVAMAIATTINDSGVFAVVAQDASQYIQNILTTSGLVFSILVGQTYYFMYQQQEKTYYALYDEVSMAKMLLEQIALVCQGREQLYQRILQQMDKYVRTDLRRFNDIEPALMISSRPCDDPLEDILFLTSVGEPSSIYQTVRGLRQARAFRLGALQRKLPNIHMTLLWVLAGIVLLTFPLLGAGVQTIGGTEILAVQSWYLGFIVFGMSLTLGVIYELRRPGESGAYNARTVLSVMVEGLEEELRQRLQGEYILRQSNGSLYGPSIDADGSFDQDLLLR